MTDFEAAVSRRVRFWHGGRVRIPPSRSRADLGRFSRSSQNGFPSGTEAVRGYDCDAGKKAYAAEGGISP